MNRVLKAPADGASSQAAIKSSKWVRVRWDEDACRPTSLINSITWWHYNHALFTVQLEISILTHRGNRKISTRSVSDCAIARLDFYAIAQPQPLCMGGASPKAGLLSKTTLIILGLHSDFRHSIILHVGYGSHDYALVDTVILREPTYYVGRALSFVFDYKCTFT